MVAVALAVAPFRDGHYDATLAVLTATLITVVWYTYFTYRAVHREPETFLLTALKWSSRRGFDLMPSVRNPMPRAISVWVHVEVWVDGQPIDLGPFYRGEEARPLDAQQGFRGWLDLGQHLRHHQDSIGEVVWDTREMCARMQVRWADALGDTGTTLPLHLCGNSPIPGPRCSSPPPTSRRTSTPCHHSRLPSSMRADPQPGARMRRAPHPS